MKLLTSWLREYLPGIPADDAHLAEDLTLRGIAVEGIFPVENSSAHIFEMDITTNRVDAMNHYGVAREAAAIYNLPLPALAPALPAAAHAAGHPVRIEAPDRCGRFTTRIIRGVNIAPTTGPIADKFAALGLKSISNAVDASNFVLHGMGHPTHAFDLDKLEGAIIVRLARAGEKLRLLDGSERTLAADDLVVADEKKAVALAGVMGGWDTMITANTRNILIEAAWFDPASIRRSARRHLLFTDASHRFERGADFAAAPLANDLVAATILASAGGTLTGPLVDIVEPAASARTILRAPVPLTLAEVRRHLGLTLDEQSGGPGLTAAIVEQFLAALGCSLATSNGGYSVTLPSWRLDLDREIDLIEEVARVYGYNKFANTLPGFAGAITALPFEQQDSLLRSRLLALGFNEAISTSFCSAAEVHPDCPPQYAAVPLGNPLSEEASVLRFSLTHSMVGMLAHNLNRDVPVARLFEMGTVFHGGTAQVTEQTWLSLGAYGNAPATALYPAKDALFFEVKSAIEDLLSRFDATLTFDPAAPEHLTPGRSAVIRLNGSVVGCFGELHPAKAERRKFKQTVVLAELMLPAVYAFPLRRTTAAELSRFPAVDRDFSFTFADSVHWSAIQSAVAALNIPTLTSLAPVEIFRDPKGNAVPAGSYSILVRAIFQSKDATLRDEELTLWSSQIIAALTALGGKLRA